MWNRNPYWARCPDTISLPGWLRNFTTWMIPYYVPNGLCNEVILLKTFHKICQISVTFSKKYSITPNTRIAIPLKSYTVYVITILKDINKKLDKSCKSLKLNADIHWKQTLGMQFFKSLVHDVIVVKTNTPPAQRQCCSIEISGCCAIHERHHSCKN